MKRPGCAFSLDDVRADVLVARDGVSVRYTEAPTFTCSACGLRLAWVPAAAGRVDAVFGLDLDSLVPGRVPRCGSLAREASGGDVCPECGDEDDGAIRCGDGEIRVGCATCGVDGAA